MNETLTAVVDAVVLSADEAIATTEAITEVPTHGAFAFTPDGLKDTLPIMGKGMLGIFIVIAIIIVCVALLNNFTAPDRKAKKAAKKAAKAQAQQTNINQ